MACRGVTCHYHLCCARTSCRKRGSYPRDHRCKANLKCNEHVCKWRGFFKSDGIVCEPTVRTHISRVAINTRRHVDVHNHLFHLRRLTAGGQPFLMRPGFLSVHFFETLHLGEKRLFGRGNLLSHLYQFLIDFVHRGFGRQLPSLCTQHDRQFGLLRRQSLNASEPATAQRLCKSCSSTAMGLPKSTNTVIASGRTPSAQ